MKKSKKCTAKGAPELNPLLDPSVLEDLANHIRQEIDNQIIEELKKMADPLSDLKNLIKKAKRNVRRSTAKAKSAKTHS